MKKPTYIIGRLITKRDFVINLQKRELKMYDCLVIGMWFHRARYATDITFDSSLSEVKLPLEISIKL